MQKLRWGAGRTGASMVGVYTLGLVACAGQSTEQGFATVHDDLTAEAANAVALRAGATCDELLAELQNQLLTQVSERAEQARVSAAPYYGGGVFIDDVVPAFGAPLPAPAVTVANAAATNAAAPSAVRSSAGIAGFSSTTVQVPGVDEGDFVKVEGDRIYLIHGTDLYVLGAASAAATEILATVPIEGQAAELFVSDGRVVVFSHVYGPLPGSGDQYSPYYYYYPTYTKLTVLDAASGTFDVLRESYAEGSYGSSRRNDNVVSAVLQQYSKAQLDYPNVSYVDIFGHPRGQAEIDLQVDLWVLLSTESIEESVIEDYVPSAFERVGGELVRQPLNCGGYLQPGPGLTQAGATSVITLDVDAPGAPLGNLTVLGYSDYAFTGTDSIILRQTDYADVAGELPTVATNLHRFALDGAVPTYTGSGRISGYVQGQFGLDELDGVIRVSAVEDRYATDADAGGGYAYLGTAGHVVALASDTITELGRSADFGRPEEYPYSTQFIGDRGYVLSSGRTTRLSVINLSDPAAPTIAGQVLTTGYTTLLYPLSRGVLLGFGQGGDATGVIQNVALQLFDVADASAPSQTEEFVFPEPGYSEALYDPRALSFHPRRNTLAFQHQSYNTGSSSLEVFQVSPGAGFTHLGSVVPPEVDLTLVECLQLLGYPTDPEVLEQLEQDPAFAESLLQTCRSYNANYVRRGLFRGNDLYAIAQQNVSAYSLDALSGPPLSQVELPNPSYYYAYPYPIPLAGAATPIE
jgi:Beta propeller domain